MVFSYYAYTRFSRYVFAFPIIHFLISVANTKHMHLCDYIALLVDTTQHIFVCIIITSNVYAYNG